MRRVTITKSVPVIPGENDPRSNNRSRQARDERAAGAAVAVDGEHAGHQDCDAARRRRDLTSSKVALSPLGLNRHPNSVDTGLQALSDGC